MYQTDARCNIMVQCPSLFVLESRSSARVVCVHVYSYIRCGAITWCNNYPVSKTRAPDRSTAGMALNSCSSEDETPQTVRFKKRKSFLDSESDAEEERELRGSRRSTKQRSYNRQGRRQGSNTSDEDEEKNSSEDETPKRGRFRKFPDHAHERQETEDIEDSESSSSGESVNEDRGRGNRRRFKTRQQAEPKEKVKQNIEERNTRPTLPVTRSQRIKDTSSSSEESETEMRKVVTRSLKIQSGDDEDEKTDKTGESEDESDDENVKMPRKSPACVISSSSDDDGGSVESETKLFEVKTKSFHSRFSQRCSHPSCDALFIVGETNIIGVLLWNSVTMQFEETEKGKLFWICAKHSSFANPKGEPTKMVNEDEEDEEPNTEDEAFIDDRDQSEELNAEGGNEFKKIVEKLKRQTTNDKMNGRKYLEEQSKYQLAIHTETNPGLHLSPEKRFKRNLRTAAFDKVVTFSHLFFFGYIISLQGAETRTWHRVARPGVWLQ